MFFGSDSRKRVLRCVATAGITMAAMTFPAAPGWAALTANCNWFIQGAEHINGTPVTVVLNENLDVPKELCDDRLMVQVDFEESSGMVHVRFFSTKTGEPVGTSVTFHVPT